LAIPTTPLVLRNYTYRDDLDASVQIHSISYQFEDSYDGSAKLKIIITGQKTYDGDLFNTRSKYFKIGYKVFNNDIVVEGSTAYTESIAVGDKFQETITIYHLETGNYVLKLLDVQ
jgi:hypothetical protein